MDLLKPSAANSSPITPVRFLERAATIYGDYTSIIYNKTTYTWNQTSCRCLQLASALKSIIGIKRGDVISVLSPNIPAMYELHFAVPMSGAILNTINTRLDARTISILLCHSESKLIFVEFHSHSVILEAFSLLPPEIQPPMHIFISDDADVIENSSFTVDSNLEFTYESLLMRGDLDFQWERPHSEWDPMVLNYTSGTTSSPKAGEPPPAPVLLRTESLGFVVSHGYGLTETAAIVVSCPWKPEWNKLPATERARLKARQGVKTLGMTENYVLDPESGASVKRDGLSLGEIVLRGGSIFLGYLNDAVGTRKCLKDDGWFYTGDVSVLHPDGYLEIKDRSKDVIISGGENISSVEVESVLYLHPAIDEAAVVARPDEYWGETPCAFVSLKPEKSHPSQKDIIEFCRAKMLHYMVPKTVVFEESLPKTATGKIQKFVLREKAKAVGAARRI
ncbi:hypothetical protein MKW98_030538 [Papaver atlanticum]|uniref:4-coumarate--CoA ligase n=1 Tax=Papaver atlanticum TaxID=357466 RepID=A0AAD4XRT7_9MAGN|nr:hypothetical protein MKW98_030538 [Papaver atlanticum]